MLQVQVMEILSIEVVVQLQIVDLFRKGLQN